MVDKELKIDCGHRIWIDELNISWCGKYFLVIPTRSNFCVGCSRSRGVKKDLEIRADKFNRCFDAASKTGFCEIFEMKTDREKCLLCKSNYRIRARFHLEYLKRRDDIILDRVRNFDNEDYEKLKTSLLIIKKLLYSPGETKIDLLEKALDSWMQRRRSFSVASSPRIDRKKQ